MVKLHYTDWRNSIAEVVYLFMYDLIYDAIIIIDHIASNDRMTVKNDIGKNVDRSDRRLM
jgi:hypothetical protein